MKLCRRRATKRTRKHWRRHVGRTLTLGIFIGSVTVCQPTTREREREREREQHSIDTTGLQPLWYRNFAHTHTFRCQLISNHIFPYLKSTQSLQVMEERQRIKSLANGEPILQAFKIVGVFMGFPWFLPGTSRLFPGFWTFAAWTLPLLHAHCCPLVGHYDIIGRWLTSNWNWGLVLASNHGYFQHFHHWPRGGGWQLWSTNLCNSWGRPFDLSTPPGLAARKLWVLKRVVMGQLPYFVQFGKGSWNIYAYREVTFPRFFLDDWISLDRTSPKMCHPKWVNRGSRHAGGTLQWQMLIYPLSWSNWQYLDNVGSISGKSYRRHRLTGWPWLTGWLFLLKQRQLLRQFFKLFELWWLR